MDPFTAGYDRDTPRLLRKLDGGWLAVSGPGACIRIGVEANTAEEARERFKKELAAWVAIQNETASESH